MKNERVKNLFEINAAAIHSVQGRLVEGEGTVETRNIYKIQKLSLCTERIVLKRHRKNSLVHFEQIIL